MPQLTPPAAFDVHFLLFAPGLNQAWFFRAARTYWITFRPVVYSMNVPDDLALVGYAVEKQKVVAVTLIMRRDTAFVVRSAFTSRYPAVFFDPLVYDAADDLALTLDGRARLGQRFGVPTLLPADSPLPEGEGPGVRATRTPGPVVPSS